MGAGRAAAQASHASNAFIHKFGKRRDVKEWQKQTKQGFGTAIVLGVNYKKLAEFFVDGKNIIGPRYPHTLTDWVVKELVYDPDYVIRISTELLPYLFTIKTVPDSIKDNTVAVTRKEVTCGYVFGTKEELQPFLGDLPLYG